MRRVRRLALVILTIALLLVAGVAILGVVAVRRPYPQTDGTLAVAGLQAEVDVLRDEWGIPHIYADNTHDLFFAQGYVHAQDRFWQMDFWRHVSAGRLSEVAGEGLVESDTFIRTMGWNRMARDTLAHYESEEPEMMAILEAYSAGVNAYIDANRGKLSVNHTILGRLYPREIEPWTPLNTVGWGVVMSDDLSGNWSDELARAQLIQALGEERVAELIPLYPENRPVIVPGDAISPTGQTSLPSGVDWSRVNTDVAGALAPGLALGAGEVLGSNNWVIGGEHTDTGMPLLANDPHLGIQMPSIWYEVGLHAPEWNVRGFSFAGVPGVIIGHNERIAWGVTNGTVDTQDLFIERVNPDNPRQYEFMGEWRDMEVFSETIHVSGGEDVTLEVLATHHGPIINPVIDETSDVLAMQWTATEPARLLKSVIMLNQAEGYEDFREALTFWDIPAQNFVYADVDGNIGYQLPGLIPMRRNGNGLLPVPGWTGEYEWEGYVPYEEMPALFNPDNGYIVTANNAVVDEAYPHLLGHVWDNGDRAQRIVNMVEAELVGDGKISVGDIARMQSDSYSMMAADYQPILASLSSPDRQVQDALQRMSEWDLQARRDSVAAALWEITWMHLTQDIFADETGEAMDLYNNFGNDRRILIHRLAGEPEAEWWDNVNTPERETREQILLGAVGKTIGWFEQNIGGEMDDWQWGRIHTATFVSNPLGQSGISLVERLVNRGPYPADGSASTVNANGWSTDNPAAIGGHVSMRMIVDVADWERSLTVHSTGQSGHPYHPHYMDMFEEWQTGRHHPMLWSREAVEPVAEGHLVLQPQP